MTCPACTRAETHPRTGIYTAGCYACEVRAVAQSPKHIREQAYAQQLPGALEQFKADVLAAFKRVQHHASTTESEQA